MIEEKAWMQLLSHAVTAAPEIAGEVMNSSRRIWQLLADRQPQDDINTPLHRNPPEKERNEQKKEK